ncbi:hypothetical protein ACFY0A_34205 [Streptomyces sp. NPDC001698]|uniref:hypothetical protein n=1 Tax=unclassified Streptomyces TaxID=2593676 RepID=UPI0036BB7E91
MTLGLCDGLSLTTSQKVMFGLVARGLSLVGHADETAAVNRLVPRRSGLEVYVQWRE